MSVTHYFRSAVAAQMNPRIDFKNTPFIKTSFKTIEGGYLDPYQIRALFEHEVDSHDKNKDSGPEALPVLIAVKTIASDILDTVKTATSVDDLTAVFFLPAIASEDGQLHPPKEKLPWFVREFLSPMVEPEISIGREEDVDRFLRESVADRYQIDSWKKYWKYAGEMYEYVTHSDYESDAIGNLEGVSTDGNCYVFCDKTVNASFHILRLYDNLLSSRSPNHLPLYQQFTFARKPSSRPLVKDDLKTMESHCGQMGGEYPLSPSQREAINHLNRLETGEILAVSGPPGTGKTTLLQSVVADMVTKHALLKKEPPIIVASSTNNQAVTNIIDSFGHVTPQGFRNLERRWVPVVNSFAAYFPSAGKETAARKKQYPIGEDMFRKTNDAEIIAGSQKSMVDECREFFSRDLISVHDCRETLHTELVEIENLRIQILNEFDYIIRLAQGITPFEYICSLAEEIENQKNKITLAEENIQRLRQQRKSLLERVHEWEENYKDLPCLVRWFLFLPFCKKKVSRWIREQKNDFEIGNVAFQNVSSLEMIFQAYEKITEESERRICEETSRMTELQRQLDMCVEKYHTVLSAIDKYYESCLSLSRYGVDLFRFKDKGEEISEEEITAILLQHDLNSLNQLMDTSVRYIQFWLAVHYYECTWLISRPLSEKQLNTSIVDVVEEKIKRLAMLCPCMVMTFFMLPKIFNCWDNNEKVGTYLYNYIDLLIVDEAGQTSPEIAAPSFALAKKAIVVGDEQQLEPVWGITRPLDIAMALEANVISKEEDFYGLEELGLNTSQSSVMRVAARSCPYNKFDHGLFLCEHRRCYDEIISYCNELVYGNKLQACRGKGIEDTKRPIDPECFPILGYYNIHTERSGKCGSSRVNFEEADQIAAWLKLHYETLCSTYVGFDKRDVLAIITPFKEQANILRTALKRALGNEAQNISVGTVHTFQGGERRIIIFSTTYGSQDNCYFIDHNRNLINVAVSRAKDAFWVFGSYDCLMGKPLSSASGLLCEYIKNFPIL